VLDSHLTSGYLDFGLFDAFGNEIAGSDDSNIYDGENGKFSKTATVSGVYYIKIWGSSDAAGTYDLAVYNAWFNPGVTDSQRDYYSTYYTARYIQDGNYSADKLGVDLYRFTAQPNTQIEVAVTAHLGAGDLNFGIYEADGRKIASSNDDRISNGQTGTATVNALKVNGGLYYVKVSDYNDAVGTYDLVITGADANTDTDGDGLYDAAEYYHGTDVNNTDTDGDGTSDYAELLAGSDSTIAVEYSSADVFGAVDQANAILIPSLDEVISVEYAGTATWYAIDLTAGHGYTILLNAHLNSGALDFALYDENEVKIVGSSDTRINNGQIGIAEKTIGTTGRYFIKVWEYTGSGAVPASGKFDLVVHNAWFNPGVTDSQRDYYSTYYTARYIQSGNYSATDLGTDFYRFTVQEGTQVDVSVTAHLGFGGLDFGIFTSDGCEIAASNDGNISDGQTGSATLAAAEVIGCLYYVRVWDSSDAAGTYDLLISGYDTIATIHINPVSHYFGDVNVGDQPQQLFTVSNTGELDLVIGDLSITGDPEFTIQSDGCSQNTLSQFETSTFAVLFSPSSEGEKSTIISIPSNDSDRPVLNVLLSGKGVVVIVDSDNDGLSDVLENTTCTDPFDADSDDDGIF